MPDDQQAGETAEIYRQQRETRNADAQRQAAADRARMHQLRERQAAAR